MKIEILIDNQIINTQIVSEALLPGKPSLSEAKKHALKAALQDRAIKLSDALRATFRVYDVVGKPIDDD